MAQPVELSKLQNHLDSIQTESKKFERYQLAMEAHLKDLSAQLTQLDVDDKEHADKVEALESELQSRAQVLKNQQDAGVDFPDLWNKLSALRRCLPINEKKNLDIEAEIERNEVELEQDREKVETMVKEYNRIRGEVLPERDDLEMKPGMTEGERLNIQEIRVQWRDMRGRLNERSDKLEMELVREKTQEENWEEIARDRQRTKASVVSKASQLDDQIQQKKEGHQRKTQQLRSRIEAQKGRRNPQQSDVIDAKKKRVEEAAAVKEMVAKNVQEAASVRRHVEKALVFCEEHKWKDQGTLQKFLKDQEDEH